MSLRMKQAEGETGSVECHVMGLSVLCLQVLVALAFRLNARLNGREENGSGRRKKVSKGHSLTGAGSVWDCSGHEKKGSQ